MGRERYIGYVKKVRSAVFGAAIGAFLIACAEEAVQPSAHQTPTLPPSPTRGFTPSVTPEPTPIPFRGFPTATAESTQTKIPTIVSGTVTAPVSEAPRPMENRAARFDGRDDGLKVESNGVLLTGPFRIEAKMRLEGNVGGDTLISKGDGFAVFARSLRCLDKIGLLLDGKDVCTDIRLGLNTFNEVVVNYDGNEVTIIVNDQEVLKKAWQGPLQISSADLMIGRRTGVSRQQFTGLIDDLRIFDGGELVYFSDFNKSFSDQSLQKRKVTILGDPKLEVVK